MSVPLLLTPATLSSTETGFKVFLLSEVSLSILLLGTVQIKRLKDLGVTWNFLLQKPYYETVKDFPLFSRLVTQSHEPLHRLAECPVRGASGRARLPVKPRVEPLLCHHVASAWRGNWC